VWIYVREEKTAWTGGVARTAGVVITCAVLALTAATVVRSLGHTAFLHGGGDPLTYGSDARSILLGDTLLLRGWPLGQARPFFHYPLYPYVLAGAHAVAGDDLSTILLLNGLALSLLPWLFWQLGWARLRWPAAIAANLALLVFIRRYCWPIASYLQPSFPDMLFMPIVFGTLVMLRRSFEEPRPWHLIATGILMGLGAAARPSFLTMVLLAPFGLLVAMWPRRGIPWIAASGWLAAGVLAALLPFTMRNVVAAGQFVVLVNSWVQIPYFLIPPEVTDRPVGAMTLGHALGMARDIVAKDPLGALWVEARKLIFSLGYMSAGPRGASTSNSLTLFTAAFALAVWLRRLRSPVITVLGLFVVSHLCAMILAAPWTFGMKAILPLHGAFLFGAAYLLDPRAASEAPAPGSRLASSTPDRQG
jgi:hypothetical protein